MRTLLASESTSVNTSQEVLGLPAPFAAAIVTAAAALIGILIANNIWRQRKIGLAKHRKEAYAALFAKMRRTSEEEPELDDDDRARLFGELTKWYYKSGNGMFLPAKTFDLWQKVRDSLTCPDKDIVPKSLREKLIKAGPTEYCRSAITKSQFSLLRTQMKADLAVYREDISSGKLEWWNRDLLKACRIPLWKKPWRGAGASKGLCRAINIFCLVVGGGFLFVGAVFLWSVSRHKLPWPLIPRRSPEADCKPGWYDLCFQEFDSRPFLVPVLLIIAGAAIAVWGSWVRVLLSAWNGKRKGSLPWKPSEPQNIGEGTGPVRVLSCLLTLLLLVRACSRRRRQGVSAKDD